MPRYFIAIHPTNLHYPSGPSFLKKIFMSRLHLNLRDTVHLRPPDRNKQPGRHPAIHTPQKRTHPTGNLQPDINIFNFQQR